MGDVMAFAGRRDDYRWVAGDLYDGAMSPDELRRLGAARAAAANGELRKQRESRHLLIQEVADNIGVSPLTLSRWEKGATTPRNSAVLLRLAEVLGITAGAA